MAYRVYFTRRGDSYRDGDTFREVPSFDLVDFRPSKGAFSTCTPTADGSLIALSSYGGDRLWVGEFINGGRFQLSGNGTFADSDGYSQVQGPFGVTWVRTEAQLFLVNTHFEAHAISIFDFTNWESREC